MNDTLTRYLEGLSDQRTARALRYVLETLVDRYSSQPLTSAGLLVNTATAKIGTSDFYACVNGIPVKIAASTTMPALTGINIPATYFGIVAFFVSSAGTITVAAGTPGASLAAATFPKFPKQNALIGFLIITYASAFTGGTTGLATATTVYVSPVGPFDPSALI